MVTQRPAQMPEDLERNAKNFARVFLLPRKEFESRLLVHSQQQELTWLLTSAWDMTEELENTTHNVTSLDEKSSGRRGKLWACKTQV